MHQKIFIAMIGLLSWALNVRALPMAKLSPGKSRCYSNAHLKVRPGQKLSALAILISNDDGNINAHVMGRQLNKKEVLYTAFGCEYSPRDTGGWVVNCETLRDFGFRLRPHASKNSTVMDVLVNGMSLQNADLDEVPLDKTNNAYELAESTDLKICEDLRQQVPERVEY